MSEPRYRFEQQIPPGDDRARLVCGDCGFVNYENPKIVVGAVATWQSADGAEQVLLCRRAINPRRGFWTLPAGFLELGESTEQGARREAWEEARADLAIGQLLAIYAIPRLSQVQLIYRARLVTPSVAAGPESEAVGLFGWDEIPWQELAFPSVRWALAHHREAPAEGGFAPFANPPGAAGAMSELETKPGESAI